MSFTINMNNTYLSLWIQRDVWGSVLHVDGMVSVGREKNIVLKKGRGKDFIYTGAIQVYMCI